MNIDCPYCRHENASLYKDGADNERPVYECRTCGGFYPRPRYSPKELTDHHAELFTLEDAEELERNYSNAVRDCHKNFLSRTLKKFDSMEGKKALDIGCSMAANCRMLELLGCDTYGLEPQQFLVDFAARKGHKVYQGFFPDNIPEAVSERKYDLITVLESLYYFYDLKRAFEVLHELLAPGGVLLLKIHQINSAFYDNGASLFTRYGQAAQGMPSLEALNYWLMDSGFSMEKPLPFPEDFLKTLWGINLPGGLKIAGKVFNKLIPRKAIDISRVDRLVIISRKKETAA